ncbi:MAG: collagen-like protein [Bacillus sp. (in: firmicutes)]
MATKEELKAMFNTGKKPTGADFGELIEGVVGPKGDKGATGAAGPAGPKGDKGDTGAVGPKGDKGDKGDTGTAGVGVKSIALTVSPEGAVTGGTLTKTDNSTAPITITTA